MTELILGINRVIINPLIILLLAVATIVFFWGVVQFIAGLSGVGGEAGDEAIQKGKRSMLWGLIGIFIMFSVFGIIRVILGTFGIDLPPGAESVLP